MYLITELNNRVIVCYPEGDKMVFASKDVATDYATVISANNPGVFQVQEYTKVDRRFRWMRAITDWGTNNQPVKITHYTGDAFGPVGDL